MRYFLDFDRTIFNTSSFKNDLSRRHKFLLHLGLLRVTPEEMKKFLYPDVPAFLESHDCTIVTYGVRAFIMAKVTSALSHIPDIRIVYTAELKGPVIKKLTEENDEPCTFVDDMHFQLASVSKDCPNVSVYEMRRDGREGDGRWSVIRSLDELRSK